MKGLNIFGSRTLCGCLFTILLAGSLPLQAQQAWLTNNNSVIGVNPTATSGLNYWSVNGVKQLAQQSYFFRLGSAAELPINAISAGTISFPDYNILSLAYAGSGLSISVDYTLSGGPANSGSALMGEVIRIVNNTTAPMDFHFFEYSDFNLSNVQNGQTVQFLGLNRVRQYYGSQSVTYQVSPAGTLVEANVVNNTLASLTDVNPTTLNGNLTAAGDVTWAFQWDFSIPAGRSQLISTTFQIPEPSTFALGALGLLAWAGLRKRLQH